MPPALCVLTNNPDQVFQRSVIAGVREEADAHGYPVSVCVYDTHQIKSVSQFAGIIAIANAVPDDVLRTFYHEGKPLSLISHQISNCPVPTVASNNAQGIVELVRYLVEERGRRNLIYVRGLPEQLDAQQRERAYREELIRREMPIREDYFLRGDFEPSVAVESLQALLADQKGELPFDAVLSADYMMGIAIVEALRRAGIAVPEQVSVVGYGDGAEAEAANLTTVAANVTELGRCAVRQVMHQVAGKRISGATVLSTRLVMRET